MPTKENGSGGQQPYDEKTGKFKSFSKPNSEESTNIDGHNFYGKLVNGRQTIFVDEKPIKTIWGDSKKYLSDELGKYEENKDTIAKLFKDYQSKEELDLEILNELNQKGISFDMDKLENVIPSLSSIQTQHANKNDGVSFDIGFDFASNKYVFKDIDKEKWQQRNIEKEKEQAKIKAKEHKKEFSKKMDSAKSIDEILSFDRNDLMNYLDDEPLYTNETFDISRGGYKGQSKSNRAIRSEENGQFPKTKWNKSKVNEILDKTSFSDNDHINDYVKSAISKMSDKEIRENLIENSSWHHTGSFYNQTNYYGLKSPKKIMEYVLEHKKQFKQFKKGE